MLAKILQELNLQPSVEYIDLYSFIKFVECFRLKDNISIKEFYNNNKKQLGLYYFAAGAGLSQSTPAFLEEIGISDYDSVYEVIKENSDIIFKYLITLNTTDYFSAYCKQAENGELDKLLNAYKGEV